MLTLNNARSWLSRRRTMNTLRGLSNETLEDIGLTRFDVARSARQAR
ncbi:DUF1127 domain-containing protein [Georhizobium profundi]|uniref:DUF1127 domain-containing protein n=1 Tax=Georhizobium profundi TaxID=2341112 RepID=A0A3S9B5H5_9HYPH|nr:DUF1127 domain-containing protein [Georhizobium profundi]AZN72183.1 DUF1127 domain-containing protein [Georhizobium profundi]